MSRWAKGALALLAWTAGCQQILDIPSETIDAVEAVDRTCECDELANQGPQFVARCTSSYDQLVSDVASGDLGAEAAALNLVDNGCTACESVASCYAILADAAPLGTGCLGSEDCETWACTTAELELEITESGPEIDTVDNEQPSCADACDPCAAAISGFINETPAAVCAEGYELLVTLLECVYQHHESIGGPDGGGPCDGFCSGFFADARICIGCMYQRAQEDGACTEEDDDCTQDRGRPFGQGG